MQFVRFINKRKVFKGIENAWKNSNQKLFTNVKLIIIFQHNHFPNSTTVFLNIPGTLIWKIRIIPKNGVGGFPEVSKCPRIQKDFQERFREYSLTMFQEDSRKYLNVRVSRKVSKEGSKECS